MFGYRAVFAHLLLAMALTTAACSAGEVDAEDPSAQAESDEIEAQAKKVSSPMKTKGTTFQGTASVYTVRNCTDSVCIKGGGKTASWPGAAIFPQIVVPASIQVKAKNKADAKGAHQARFTYSHSSGVAGNCYYKQASKDRLVFVRCDGPGASGGRILSNARPASFGLENYVVQGTWFDRKDEVLREATFIASTVSGDCGNFAIDVTNANGYMEFDVAISPTSLPRPQGGFGNLVVEYADGTRRQLDTLQFRFSRSGSVWAATVRSRLPYARNAFIEIPAGAFRAGTCESLLMRTDT
jgi:hypothetical protein